jgi:imidazolonepropionase-like amidohydrolase
MQFIRFFLLLFFVSYTSLSQEGFPINGVEDNRDNHYAFINAKIFVDYKTVIENGTLIIKNGRIISVGKDIETPKGVKVFNLEGKFIYPSFIDLYTDYGIVKNRGNNQGGGSSFRNFMSTKTESEKLGPYGWNEAINAEYNVVENIKIDEKKSKQLRDIGFGSVVSHNMDGIMRGSGALLLLSDNKVQDIILKQKSSVHYSFIKGTSTQNYPNSLMGSVALLKQSFYDSDWYKSKYNNDEVNLTLQSINKSKNLPQIIEVRNKIRVLLAQKIGKELDINFIIKGNGDEYQRINEIKNGNSSLIVPINYPKPFNVDDPFNNNNISLSQLKHWEMAPSNLYFLDNNGISFSITSNGLKNLKDFRKNLIKAISRGISKEAVLKALTYNPAKMINMSNRLGSIKESYIANFIILDGDIFSDKTKLISNWVDGSRHEVSDYNLNDLSGSYSLNIDNNKVYLKISGDINSPKAIIKNNQSDSIESKATLKVKGDNISLNFKLRRRDYKLSGYYSDGILKGRGTVNNLDWIDWNTESLIVSENKIEAPKRPKRENKEVIGDVIYPFVEYGSEILSKQEKILIKNTTVWTLEKDGILKESDVLINNGKIVSIGKNIPLEDAKLVDGSGMHLTPGIIDEHSHMALSGTNEGSQAVTSEVRMKDVVNSEDVNIYRQLAGGVTAAQLLHGSANPIGGQSAIIKLRWGSSPDEMLIDGADEYIKFALGENVKRSRSTQNTRFPDTRMGVEQVFVDAFNRAKIYDNKWKKYNSLSKKEKLNTVKPRKDLELDALVEILKGERFITCHSYVQSEINMLIKVAEQFDFNVNTFTHILEGYKVADKMSDHGVGASTFSDWWAYKNEVKEAIPYNAALMNMAGVVTAINSDDREMARRLNQEAAKSIKYGNMSEIDALKMVTLNPAKLLHLDDRMGSIRVGKDADLVLWTDHPLSIYSKPSKTLVDGKVYFDLDKDLKLRDKINEERARIISKMKGDKTDFSSRRIPFRRFDLDVHCDDIIEYETLIKMEN